MTKILCSTRVNIDTFPLSKATFDCTDLSLGDLHGNAIKLMYFLVYQGICTLSPADYDRLVAIYKTTPLNHELLVEFNLIVSGIKIINQQTLIRLLGDELGDRGNNDYFTLIILQKLVLDGANVEILLSNHGAEFVEAYELYTKRGNLFQTTRLDPVSHAPSLVAMANLVEQQLITAEEIMSIVERIYKPLLKIIGYSLSLSTGGITIYSHAGIGLQSIRLLADFFNIKYMDASSIELATTINLINHEFARFVCSNCTHLLYSLTSMYNAYHHGITFSFDNVIEFILWNRSYDLLERPKELSGYPISFVHGHDKEPSVNNIYGLDSDVGKALDRHTELYISLASDEVQLVSKSKPTLNPRPVLFKHKLPKNDPPPENQ